METIAKQTEPQQNSTDINKSSDLTQWQKWRPFIFGGIAISILIAAVIVGAFYLFDKNKTAEKWVFIATNVLGLFALAVIICQAIIYGRQWQAMQEGLKKTDAIIHQNRQIVDVMGLQYLSASVQAIRSTEIVTEMQGQRETMNGQLVAIERQANAAEAQNTLTAQSIELARLAAEITQDQLQLARLTQRPDIDLRLRFGIDHTARRIEMLFEAPNLGHSTAYNFGIHISTAWQPSGYDGPLEYGPVIEGSAEPVRVGSPNFVHPQAIVFRDIPLYNGFFTGHNWFIVYGIYWFYDGAGERYEEVFCRRLNHLEPEHAVQCEPSLRAQVVPLDPDETEEGNTQGEAN